MFKFSNTYIDLGEQFYQKTSPDTVPVPLLLLWNEPLSKTLNCTENEKLSFSESETFKASFFSGNSIMDGSEPIALAYSGHQFGHFNPQLGDGRAHLLGEVKDNSGILRDIQLKGSGVTIFSRRGDGKCALGPALREYIMSEAMFYLGVPTSRCLAITATGEVINRGLATPGAVVTRVASSHIRVGSFQYFAARNDLVSLKSLVNYSIERHFPYINLIKVDGCLLSDEQRYLTFLDKVIDKQINLIVSWLRVGFIHGVMNTDNTAISGETIDFGPCAMMNQYDEDTVFSSIDKNGRYAFGNQGQITQWNMARLADCLIPLIADEYKDMDEIDDARHNALKKAEAIIHQFNDKFNIAYYAMFAKKLGIEKVNEASIKLVEDLLIIMKEKELDYTDTFYQLTNSLTCNDRAEMLKAQLGDWYLTWLDVISEPDSALALMRVNNPVVIPRNHHVESILSRCEEALANDNDPSKSIKSIVNKFVAVLHSPYQEIDTTKYFQDSPQDNDRYYQTFCGT